MHKKIRIIPKREKRIYGSFFAALAFFWLISTMYTGFSITEIIENSDMFFMFLTEDFYPPKLPAGSELSNLLRNILVTLGMAVSATACAGVCAFFVSLFGSESISPAPKLAKYIRGIATFMRNIPALVWAFILFSSLGIGTGVGFAALFITSFAFMVRAFIETMDETSDDCVECLLAMGASFPQRVVHGILPSCIQGYLSWFLYCFEVNIRASTIVGMVGGGGVGLVLFSYLKGFRYHMAFGVILIIAAMIILVELLTNRLRNELERKNGAVPAFICGVIICTILGFCVLDVDWLKILSRVPDIGIVFLKLLRFDFGKMDIVANAFLETITIALLSTIYSILLGIVFGMIAAENIFRSHLWSAFIKSVFTFLRAVPTPVWVLLMLVCLGFGPSAGIAGLCVHTTAFFTKAFSQSFESIPADTVEALESTGAGKFSVFTNAILPSALSQMVAWIGMRFEINFSECAILGMVGAGGIGYVISNSLQAYEYGVAGISVILVFLFAYTIERAFVKVKKIIR